MVDGEPDTGGSGVSRRRLLATSVLVVASGGLAGCPKLPEEREPSEPTGPSEPPETAEPTQTAEPTETSAETSTEAATTTESTETTSS